ncbi:hypothetical protein GCG54_00003931 [Colletotrichum gloeosporioides]|uniref:DUF6594 domain-containing protein n=1 Tax=Colletotrichum gloeosporioides TaxID=474922 RepID=A0A8H4C5Y9_COLGL|nr:uncharacterized protein GCG54_00003931 [Colletotrichum gloeosporioides]KAF3798028.1 hypothetical protein GCG54_00003931 [Colletotrichum gloeosporioides]
MNTTPNQDEINEEPWKYIGYKGYSDLITSENNLLLFRRFDALNVRVTLALQDEISLLEEELSNLEGRMQMKTAPDFHNGTLQGDIPERSSLMKRISDKLRAYSL